MKFMERSSRWTRVFIAGLAAVAAPRLADASCVLPTTFGQMLPNCGESYCYVVSPGTSTDQSLAGSFWAFGFGRPAAGQGNDNGTWPGTGWILPSGSNWYIGGDWQGNTGIDGCISGTIAPGKTAEIMVALISDVGNGGLFAAAAARRVVGSATDFDFTFAAGGGQPGDIDLVEIPSARIDRFTNPDVFELRAPTEAQVGPGTYGDGSLTDGELVKGYRVYTRPTRNGGYRTTDGWSAATGTVPIGQNAVVTVPWSGQMYFAYTLVFDGDFETAYVGRAAHMNSLCHPTDADGDGFSSVLGDPECCPIPEVCDCNDADPSVHPGVLEICNGTDDDCNAVVDDVALPGPVLSMRLGKETLGARLEWPPLAVATHYDVVRGDLAALAVSGGDFSEATTSCVANDLTATHVDDPGVPDPGFDFWYLLRAANCTGVGTYDSAEPSQPASRDAGVAAAGHACP